VRLDTFALQQTPKNPLPRRASSAHTYRLLIFKDRSAKPAAPTSITRHRFVLRRCVCSRETGLWRTSAAPSTGFHQFLNLLTALEALPLLAFPLPVPRYPKHERAEF
jgi:hypothetical protein